MLWRVVPDAATSGGARRPRNRRPAGALHRCPPDRDGVIRRSKRATHTRRVPSARILEMMSGQRNTACAGGARTMSAVGLIRQQDAETGTGHLTTEAAFDP